MRKNYNLFLIFAFIISIMFIASGLHAAEAKLGFVDVANVFDSYEKTKTQDKILEKETEKKKAEREKLVKQIRKMKDELDLLSEKAKAKKQDQINAKIADLQEYDQRTRTELGQKRDKMVRDILKEIEKAIAKYAKSNGYTVIVNNRMILYGEKQDDLTGKILSALNSK